MTQSQLAIEAVPAAGPDTIFSHACLAALRDVPPDVIDQNRMLRGLEQLFQIQHFSALKEVLTHSGIEEALHIVDEKTASEGTQGVDTLMLMSYLWLKQRTGFEPVDLSPELRMLTHPQGDATRLDRLTTDQTYLAARNAIGFLALAVQASNDPDTVIRTEDALGASIHHTA